MNATKNPVGGGLSKLIQGESNAVSRIVPSGQVYRQLFDAQPLLNQSLATRDAQTQYTPARVQKPADLDTPTIPLVRLSQEELQHGILNSRQRAWIGSLANDPYTENPVVYKQYIDQIKHVIDDSESADAWEVQGLPDIIRPAKTKGLDIVTRISENRRLRHEAVVDEMFTALSDINVKMEPLIEAVSKEFLERMEADDEDISILLERLQNDEKLEEYSMADLSTLWEQIQGHSAVREKWIAEMNSDLQKLEFDRINKIRQVFSDVGVKLKSISYLMLPDLQRFMDDEAQKINQSVLSNQRAYTDLYSRLRTADIEREHKLYLRFQKKVNNWKVEKIKSTLESFKTYMSSSAARQPKAVEKVKENILADESRLNNQRKKLIWALCEMQPPHISTNAILKWKEDFEAQTRELDDTIQMNLMKLHAEYEHTCQQFLENVESLKTKLVEEEICSSHRANQLADEYLLSLVGAQQRIFEDDLEFIQKYLEASLKKTDAMVHNLFKFANNAAILWETHQANLAYQQRQLDEHLDGLQTQERLAIQEKEAALDSVLDKLRQEASENGLTQSLANALGILENMQHYREECFEQQTELVKAYPQAVADEVDAYDTKVCLNFCVSRVVFRDMVSGENEEEGESNEINERLVKRKQKKDSETSSSSKQSQIKTTDPVTTQIITTKRGTQFCIIQEGGEDFFNSGTSASVLPKTDQTEEEAENEDHQDESSTSESGRAFLTEVADPLVPSEENDRLLMFKEFGETIEIPLEVLLEAQKIIRQNFLEHLDVWFNETEDQAKTHVLTKCEILNSQLDLRLHLLYPRPQRIQCDVHNVRAAELVLHEERVTRHCDGMAKSLSELVAKSKLIIEDQNILASRFKERISTVDQVIDQVTSSLKLKKLQKKVAEELNKFVETIQKNLRDFRQYLDSTLLNLRGSNANFMKEFKLFSEGGNFCPEEVDVYRKRLEKLAQLINQSEGQIMAELEGVESKHVGNANKIWEEFEDRLKKQVNDLVFTENISRWVTNMQVKIKGEVAFCNNQASDLEQMLTSLQQRIDEDGTADADNCVDAAWYEEALKALFDACVHRFEYLCCGRVSSQLVDAGSALDPNTDKDSNKTLLFTNEDRTRKQSLGQTISTIKEILKTQTGQRNSGEKEEERSPPENKSLPPSAGFLCKSGTKGATESPPKRSTSGRLSRGGKVDKKPLYAEICDSSVKARNFMGSVHQILKDASVGLQALAEVFYNQKGKEPITRPEAIPETSDQCFDIIQQKLQAYALQAEDYASQSVREFSAQLARLERVCARVPPLLISSLLKTHKKTQQEALARLADEFQPLLSKHSQKQKQLQNELRPKLGHPHYAADLAALCAQEEEERTTFLESLAIYIKKQQESAAEHAGMFLEKLAETAELQLVLYDKMMISDDVDKGKAEPKTYHVCQLIRRQKTATEKEDLKPVVPRGPANWIGIPSNQFVVGDKPSTLEVTTSVQTLKTSLAHTATIEARDSAFQDYKNYFDGILEHTDETQARLVKSEDSWQRSWQASVQKVSSLYSED